MSRRVAILASYPTVQFGLRAAVESYPDWEVLELVSDLRDLELQAELDVILADIEWDAEEIAAGTLLESLPPVLLLVESEEEGAQALTSGVRGLLLRDAEVEEIIAGLTAVAAGLVVLDERIQAVIAPPAAQPDVADGIRSLTPREIEVIQLIARGEPNKGIARELGISEHTVKFHVGSILAKLGAASRSEALARAISNGLISI